MKYSTPKRIAAAAGACFLLLILLLPQTVLAASSSLNSIDIVVELEEDGTATITEVWDVTASASDNITELFITKHNLDEQDIWDLTVTDASGQQFENIGRWDSSRSKLEKEGQCGLIETKGGYEICWGFGSSVSYGNNVYTVQYKMSGVVKGYNGADAIDQWFVSRDLFSTVPEVSVTIRRADHTFTPENTGVWGFGMDGEIYVQNGQVELNNTKPLKTSQYVAILVEFEPGMFTPAVVKNRSFEDVKNDALKGSGYRDNTGGSGIFITFKNGIKSFMLLLPIAFSVLFAFFRRRGSSIGGMSKKQYAQVPYSREIPYHGSLPTTYTRIKTTGGLGSTGEGSIIGAYLLRWARTRQIEMVKELTGVFQNKETESIKLYAANPAMAPVERALYDLLVQASGRDFILQRKEFERWSSSNYAKIERWFNSVSAEANAYLRQVGATTTVVKKSFFGLFDNHVAVNTPLGEQLSTQMYGFKRYLEDFTIINQREVREVQLWDEYLVFAQVFGIADRVAEQFKQLYPDYFTQLGNQMGMSPYDTMMMIRMTSLFSHAGNNGYRSGYRAAHAGGGGGFSGGGGGFSSGSGSSGGGFR